MKSVIYVVFAVIGVLGVLLSFSQLVVAIIFSELGRVLLYLILTVLFTELAVMMILKLVKERKRINQEFT